MYFYLPTTRTATTTCTTLGPSGLHGIHVYDTTTIYLLTQKRTGRQPRSGTAAGEEKQIGHSLPGRGGRQTKGCTFTNEDDVLYTTADNGKHTQTHPKATITTQRKPVTHAGRSTGEEKKVCRTSRRQYDDDDTPTTPTTPIHRRRHDDDQSARPLYIQHDDDTPTTTRRRRRRHDDDTITTAFLWLKRKQLISTR